MRRLNIQDPGISLLVMTSNLGPFERNWGDQVFVLYDKNNYTVQFLEQNIVEVYRSYDDEALPTPLDLCFLHVVAAQEALQQINVDVFLSGVEQFIVHPDNTQEYAQGRHVCVLSESGMCFRIEGVDYESLQLYCGYFVFALDQQIPENLNAFNKQLQLADFELISDWQNVKVPKKAFFEVYAKAIEHYHQLDFSSEPGTAEYLKFFFHG